MLKRRCLSALLVVVPLVIALSPRPGHADAFTPEQRAEITQILRDALRDDPTILRDAMAGMQAADDAARAHLLTAHRQALLADPADAVAGNPRGDVTVVEFYDPRCPYCRRMLPVMAALLAADPGVRLVYKEMPVLGPASIRQADALLAAQRQGGYAALQAALMGPAAPAATGDDALAATATTAGLDSGRLAADMRDPAIAARLDANIALARDLGIRGTPTFVIGDTVIPGAVSLPELRRAVAAARRS